METLKYKVVKTRKQYNDYCKVLEKLVLTNRGTSELDEEIELITLLIEKFDQENSSLEDVDPVAMLKSLMEEHKLKAKNLSIILRVSKGLVSDILNYKKGLSKEVIRKLATHFCMSQEAFNRPYNLKVSSNQKNVRKVNTQKQMELA